VFAGALLHAAFLAAADDPEYLLGKLRLPPIAQPASPFRLADLRYSFSRDGSTLSSFETRLRVGAGAFVGGEVVGDRLGLFFDTQRIELGVSEENGSYEVESSYRAPRFLFGARAEGSEDDWRVSAGGSLRFTNDLEVVLGYEGDLDDAAVVAGTREIQAGSAGFLYQRGSHLEVLGDVRFSRLRTAGGFDLDVSEFQAQALWNRDPVELDGVVSCRDTSGRLASQQWTASFGGRFEIAEHLLAHAATTQRWEPGILRFEDDYRAGLTFFGRRHRFARSGEAASLVSELQRRVNALGYNERRVYEVDGLRRFRERLGISPARSELEAALDELYRAEVRDRNVPQLGFELALGDDDVRTVEYRAYRAMVGVPWRVRWPFSRNEDAVEFVTAEFTLLEEDFPGVTAVSRDLIVTLWLNREMSLAFRWESPGRTVEDIAQGVTRPARVTLGFDYALGR
jgi:hypothetical protein